jgi:6,7-dimethyl-8-ribityllumazine synthase
VPNHHEGELDGDGLRIAVIVARFNLPFTERLLDGCASQLVRLGVRGEDIDVFWVPGAFELPQVAARLVDGGVHDAIVCIGCVIRGETSHYDHVAENAAAGIAAVAREAPVPVIFGVLTTEDETQAEARSGGGRTHHGEYAARAAVEMARLLERVDDRVGAGGDDRSGDAER